ncbi:mechanosensitive ion channel family protein [Profundibacter sp.]
MRRWFALCVMLISLAAFPAVSQSITGLLGGDQTTPQSTQSDTLSELMRQATESGMTVVIIDPDGKVVGNSANTADSVKSDSGREMSGLMAMQDEAVRFRRDLKRMLKTMPDSFTEVEYILRASSPDGKISTFFKTLLWSLLFFAIGMVVEREIYGRRFAKKYVIARVLENPVGYTEKLPFLVYRFFVGMGGILVSMIVAYGLGYTIFGEETDTAMQFTITVIFVAYAGIRFVTTIWRMVLAPYLCQYRIPQFSNKDARKLYYWASILATLDICSLMFSVWVKELGLNYEVYAFISSALALMVAVMNIIMVLVNRRAVSRAIRNGRPVEETNFAAKFVSYAWVPVVIIYFIYSWVRLTHDLVLQQPTSFPLIAGAYAVGTAIVVVYAIINYMIERLFAKAREARKISATMKKADNADNEAASEAVEGALDGDVIESEVAEPGLEPAAEDNLKNPAAHPLANFEDLARRVSGILAFVAGFWAFIEIWGGNMSMVRESVIERGLDIIVILFIAYIVYHSFRIWIDSKIAEEQGDAPETELGDEGGGEGASRLSTLLPLFRISMMIVIITTFTLILLSQLGINVSPLFAGAGVVGLAIGFGAQTLVRDIFSGVFFLLDDAFRKGEYIDTGDVKGTVEKISLRSMQLRHHRGPLNTIPFGEIQFLTNYSRDWVIMKLPLRVTYDTDPERVRKLIKKLGQELLEDPVIGKDFLQPLKSQGVIEMQDSAMIIRVKFMTKPGGQWMIRKRVLQEIRDLFEREGIKFAHREVTVRLAEDDNGKVQNLTKEQKEAIAAAALPVLEEDEMAENPDANGGDDR